MLMARTGLSRQFACKRDSIEQRNKKEDNPKRCHMSTQSDIFSSILALPVAFCVVSGCTATSGQPWNQQFHSSGIQIFTLLRKQTVLKASIINGKNTCVSRFAYQNNRRQQRSSAKMPFPLKYNRSSRRRGRLISCCENALRKWPKSEIVIIYRRWCAGTHIKYIGATHRISRDGHKSKRIWNDLDEIEIRRKIKAHQFFWHFCSLSPIRLSLVTLGWNWWFAWLFWPQSLVFVVNRNRWKWCE